MAAKTHLIRLLWVLSTAGCTSDIDLSERLPPGHYVLQGDTLYSIALQYNLDYRELAKLNRIAAPGYRINPGEILRIEKAARKTTTQEKRADEAEQAEERPTDDPLVGKIRIEWDWPMKGVVRHAFGSGRPPNRGIDIQATSVAEVKAAADGKVVYAGSDIKGYGNLIILEHAGDYLSTYASLQQLAVEEGDDIRQGDRLMKPTSVTNSRQQAWLHFEIRQQGQPLDPKPLLEKKGPGVGD